VPKAVIELRLCGVKAALREIDATFRFPHEIPPCAAGVLPLAFQGGNLTLHG
jgi:hypothetical protein